MTRRSGVTLVEVLVAIFVMGIGLIALLTLFPIGMLRMAQAMRDARSGEAAESAHAIAIMQNVRNDRLVMDVTPTELDGPIFDVFRNPFPTGLPSADDYGESYAVLVDPIGYNASTTNSLIQHWVGGARGGIRRRPAALTGG